MLQAMVEDANEFSHGGAPLDHGAESVDNS
jgi:hypothetical protein